MSASSDFEQPIPTKPARVKLVQGQEVSLGCGTLIIIALIVLFCGGFATRGVQEDVSQLRESVDALTKTVQDQTKEIKALQAGMEKLRPPVPAEAGGKQ